MRSNINKPLFLLIGWIFRASYQMECLRCSSSIQRLSVDDDHSCLEGTLKATKCPEPINITEKHYHQCISSVYSMGIGAAGVMINRECVYTPHIIHGCDPQIKLEDLKGSSIFYCRYPCLENGCNRHKVNEITNDARNLSEFNQYLLLVCLYFLCLLNFRYR